MFFDDLTLWGWADAPDRLLIHRTDIARRTHHLPRALAPDADRALMTAVADLDDLFARCAITVLRNTGLRLGELRDLELDCLWDVPGHGTWLKVPLGKLATERLVPVDDTTLAAIDDWMSQRGRQRSLPHSRENCLADFLFVAAGRRLCDRRIRQGLRDAAAAAGLTATDGSPLAPYPHQLRHTYATSLVNAGMSLQALMALLGHVSSEMTLRYAVRRRHRPRRLRRRDRQDPRHPHRDHRADPAAATRPGGLAPSRHAQDPTRQRLLLPAPRR